MSVMEVIQRRRSIRRYKPDPIPDDVRAPLAVVIGYPVSWPEARPRKPLDEVVCFDTYK